MTDYPTLLVFNINTTVCCCFYTHYTDSFVYDILANINKNDH